MGTLKTVVGDGHIALIIIHLEVAAFVAARWQNALEQNAGALTAWTAFGIGTALLDYGARQLAPLSIHQLVIDVNSDNAKFQGQNQSDAIEFPCL